MENKKENGFKELFEVIQLYAKNRVEYFRILILEKSASILADVITGTTVIICFTLAFILGMVTLACFLAAELNSYPAGFGIVTVLFLLIAILVLVFKDNVERVIANFSIRRIFKKLQEIEDEKEL
ncbi:phage holin family protein [Pedobacter sp. MR2016-24]|uniref:phage holin family protein n=1 Tax=Pedobacter sp. MR2016-24 TaxID=2994466 RepID=UPI0022458F93|nr:phage holin family protein [Pedobacter sp. MR2016-24]MCX2485250.1 phage holin family protein [Pedobacter sp. MR2016-24]